MSVARLTIDLSSDGGWIAHLWAEGRPRAEGRLSPAEARALCASVAEALDPEALPLVLLPGRDGPSRDAEETAGRSLAAVLESSPDIIRAVGHLQARPGSVLVVETSSAEVEVLPWELLAADGRGLPLEAEGVAVIARMGPESRSRDDTGLRPPSASIWTPSADDPAVGVLVEGLREAAIRCGLPSGGDAPLVRHWVCHGAEDGGALRLVDADGIAPGSVTHGRLQSLRGTPLVVLSICHGAEVSRVLGLSRRVIAAGARMCVAHRGVLRVQVARAFVEGLYRALADGVALPAAVAAGRRAVAALCLPLPEDRWHRFVLTVGSLQPDAWRVPQAGDPILGWPALALDARAVVDDMLEAAEPHGFVGVEHLALALVGHDHPAAGHWRVMLPRIAERVRVHLEYWRRVPEQPARPTPRLRALGRRLPPGAGLAELWSAFVDLATEPLGSLLPSAGPDELDPDATEPDTQDAETRRQGRVPAGAVRVLLGPEDGRTIALQDGVVLGRNSATSDSGALYAGCGATDPKLSRRHLIYRDGTFDLRSLWDPPMKRGARTLYIGRIWCLTRATRIVGLSDVDVYEPQP